MFLTILTTSIGVLLSVIIIFKSVSNTLGLSSSKQNSYTSSSIFMVVSKPIELLKVFMNKSENLKIKKFF